MALASWKCTARPVPEMNGPQPALATGTSEPAESARLTADQFTQLVVEAVKQADPALNVERVQTLEIDFSRAGDVKDVCMLLQNAYDSYLQDPVDISNIVAHYVFVTLDFAPAPVETSAIVAVVKDYDWLAVVSKQADLFTKQAGISKPFEYFHEPINAELLVTYAADTPSNLLYLSREQLESLGMDPVRLRQIAVKNVEVLLRNVQRQELNGVYRFVGGGTFEASLILIDGFWNSTNVPVTGGLVIGVPSRDQVFATGSSDARAVGRMREFVRRAYEQSPYRLTSTLFSYDQGQLKPLSL